MSLRVGAREFLGEGSTAQQAKHNAAAKVPARAHSENKKHGLFDSFLSFWLVQKRMSGNFFY